MWEASLFSSAGSLDRLLEPGKKNLLTATCLVCMKSAKSELFPGPACRDVSTSVGTQFLDDSKDRCFPVAGRDPSQRCPWDGSEEAVKHFVPVREQSAAFNCWLLSGLAVQRSVYLYPQPIAVTHPCSLGRNGAVSGRGR